MTEKGVSGYVPRDERRFRLGDALLVSGNTTTPISQDASTDVETSTLDGSGEKSTSRWKNQAIKVLKAVTLSKGRRWYNDRHPE